MNTEMLEKVVQLAQNVGYVFIATTDADKWPHMAAARTLTLNDDGRIDVNEWFCPGTMSNLQANRHVSVIVWDPATDIGYQLLGDMEYEMDIGMTDGYAPEMKNKSLLPQVKSELVIRVSKITDFKRAPHTDVEE